MHEFETTSPCAGRMGRIAVTALVVAAVCVLATSHAFGQTASATLTGAVTDQSGKAIPGAVVSVTSTTTDEKRTMPVEADGRFVAPNLIPGFYNIQAEKKGFVTAIVHNQEFLVGAALVQNFTLPPLTAGGPTTIEIKATEVSTAVESTKADVQRVIVTREVDALPNLDRSAGSLSSQAPGTVVAGSGGTATITIGHNASYQTGYILDGMPNQTGNQGLQYFILSQDWVQEFSVLGLQYPAEFGNASGGVIVSVSRSGGNQTHGRLYGYYQDKVLNSNPSYWTQPFKAPYMSTRFGAGVGGPIKKDKLFYYVGYEHLRVGTEYIMNATALGGAFGPVAQPIGTPASQLVPWLPYGTSPTIPETTNTNLAMLKMDYTPSSKNHFSIRGNLNFEKDAQASAYYTGKQDYGSGSNYFRDPYGVTISWTRTISPRTLNYIGVGYFQNGRSQATYDNYCQVAALYPGSSRNTEPYNYVDTASLGGQTIWGNPDGYYANVTYNTTVTGAETVGRMCGGVQNMNGNASVQDSVTMIRGAHTIKFGGLFRHEELWTRDAENFSGGAYTMAGSAGPFNPNLAIPQNFTAAGFTAAEALAPLAYNVIFPGTPGLTTFRFRYSSAGGFIQDFWKIRSNLSLDWGIRYDISNNNSQLGKESWPALEAAVPGSTGFIQPGFHTINNDPLEFAPRFGFAWMPFKKSKNTVVRGGFGIFYNANDGASVGIYITGNAWANYDYNFSANTASTNPYCIGGTTCVGGIPPQYELAVQEVLASALTNFTLPQFPISTAPCAKTGTCTVTVGPNVYNIPALSVPYVPQGARVDIDPNYRIPGVAQTTMGIQHSFGTTLLLSADYINHSAFNGVVVVNNNIGLTGPGATQSYTFINPAVTSGYYVRSIGTQNANDLQVKATYRGRHNVRVAMAYQYGHSNDDSINNFAISARTTVSNDPFNLHYDYGPSNSDIRHTLVMNATVPLYFGVDLAPIFTAASGAPYTATSSSQTPGSALAPAGCEAYFTACYPTGYSRDSLRGDATYGLNARLSKVVKLREHESLTVLFEAFNIPSWRNRGTGFFTNVDVKTGLSAFGMPTNTSNTLRQCQLGARFDF